MMFSVEKVRWAVGTSFAAASGGTTAWAASVAWVACACCAATAVAASVGAACEPWAVGTSFSATTLVLTRLPRMDCSLGKKSAYFASAHSLLGVYFAVAHSLLGAFAHPVPA